MTNDLATRFREVVSEIADQEARVALLSLADPNGHLPEAREKLMAAIYALTTGDSDPSLADEVLERLSHD